MRLFFTFGLLLWSSCATSRGSEVKDSTDSQPAQPSPSPAPLSQEESRRRLLALLARESEPAQNQTFTVRAKTLSAESSQAITVEASKDEPNTSVISLGVGGSQAMVCYLYDHALDVGSTLANVLTSVKKTLTVKSIRTVDISVVEKSPASFMEILYLAPQKAGQALGQLKLMFYVHDNAPLMCVHDEPGYLKSFQRVGASIASTVGRSISGAALPQVNREVFIQYIKEAPVGFIKTSWHKQPDGTTTGASLSSMVVSRSEADAFAVDSATVTQVALDSTIESKTSIDVMNGEPNYELKLTRTKGGKYKYSGTVQGKSLEGQLTTKDGKGLPSEAKVARMVKTLLLSGKKPSIQLEEYVPSANPAAFTPMSIKSQKPESNEVLIETGPLRATAILDARGTAESIKIEMGPVVMEQKRVFSEGQLE